MKKTTVAIILTGMAASASAQRNLVDTRVRVAGESTWQNELVLYTPYNQFVTVEVGVFFERASGFGFAGAVHKTLVNNWSPATGDTVVLHDRPDSAMHPDGRQGRFNFGPQAQGAFVDGFFPHDLRLSSAGDVDDSGLGVFERQESPVASGTLFDTGTTVLGFRFDLVLAPRLPNPTIHDLASLPYYFAVYDGEASTTATSINVNTVETDGARIIMFGVPAPSSFSLCAACALLSLRRRRA